MVFIHQYVESFLFCSCSPMLCGRAGTLLVQPAAKRPVSATRCSFLIFFLQLSKIEGCTESHCQSCFTAWDQTVLHMLVSKSWWHSVGGLRKAGSGESGAVTSYCRLGVTCPSGHPLPLRKAGLFCIQSLVTIAEFRYSLHCALSSEHRTAFT